MVRGQVATIPNAGKVLLTTLSREQKNSFSILNPNDGVIYAKLNSAANISVTDWDWKLPSQSYGQYPGPWQSLGLYYQDLSGSGASAQVNLYESDAELAIPSIVAIGRAAQVAGTQVDITQGTIPQNPPQNTSRLWVDSSGHLHLLDSTGADKTVIDNTNFASYFNSSISSTALGGDLYGTIPNGHVWAHTNPIQLDRTINVQWGTNSNVDRIVVWSDTNMYIDVTGQVTIRPGGGSTAVFSIASSGVTVNSGNATISNGTLSVTGGGGTATLQSNAITFWDAVIQRWNPQQLRMGASAGIIVAGPLQVDTTANINNGITVGGLGQFNNTLQVSGGNQIGWNNGNSYSFESTYLYHRNPSGFVFQNSSGANNVPILVQAVQFVDANCFIQRPGGTNYVQIRSYDSRLDLIDAGGAFRFSVNQQGNSGQTDFFGVNGSTNFRFFHSDTSWMGTQAANFQVQSSVEHAKLYKKPISPVSNAIDIVNAIQPVYYYHVVMKEDDTPLDPQLAGYYTYGFSAAQVATVMPELVSGDFIDYNRMIPALWQAVRDILSSLSSGGIASVPSAYVAP